MPIKQIKNSGNGGELTGWMDGRTDINKYHNGFSKLINATVLPHGGIEKRPGTQYISTAPGKTKLVPFEFSVDDALILELSDLLLRFNKNQAQVLDNAGIESTGIVGSYTIDDADAGNNKFIISDDGDLSTEFPDVSTFWVGGSTANDGQYTVVSTSFSTPDFTINVAAVADGTDDGVISRYVAQWKCNESVGTNVEDTTSVHDGTATVATSTLNVTGKVGTGAFDLDGQYTVEIADSNDFSFTDNSNDSAFSLASWIFVTEKGGMQTILSKWRDGTSTREWRFSLTNERKLQLQLADTSSDLSSDAVSQWKLNDDASNTVVVDTIALQNGVATSNTDTLTATGQLDKALDFAGTDAVTVVDNAAYSFGNGSTDSPFSIAAWVFVTVTGDTLRIVSKWDTAKQEYFLRINSTLHFEAILNDQSVDKNASATQVGTLSTGWHFLVATYDGAGGTSASAGITLYVDGALVSSTKSSPTSGYIAMENLTAKVDIGASTVGGALQEHYADKIDNVIIFDIELSLAQIQALYNGGTGTEDLTGTTPVPNTISDVALSTGWHFVTATYSAPADETTAADGIILYVDGAAVASTATNDANYVAMQNGAEEVRIGSQRNSGDSANENFWEDKIDEVSVFSDVLTPTEVASLYSTTAFSIVSPYTAAEAFQIHITQSADVMYIAHSDHHPKKLSRFDDLDWTLVDVPFTGGPFLDENIIAASLLGFARTGGTARSEFYFPAGSIGTLTASGADNQPFNSNMVGALWLVKHTRDTDNSTTTFAKDTNVVPTLETFASGAIFIKGDFTATFEPIATGKSAFLWRKAGNGNWQKFRGFQGATAFSSTEDEDDVLYAMTRSDNTIGGTLTAKDQVNRGIVKITGFTSATVVAVEVVDKVLSNNSNDNAVTTPLWAEGAWSDFRGYPRTVTFFEDRLWWASSANNPDTIWSSKSGLYENLESTDLGLDDEALTFPLNDNEVSQIQWMFARQVMAIGAANKEYRFGASNIQNPATPSDRKATPQTAFGSGALQPGILNDAIFFFQRQGKKLRAMRFDAITENFAADDATLLAYRLFDSQPTDLAFQRIPDSIIWVTRTDGVMPTFTYEPDEEVSGWARQIFGNSAAIETPTGLVESVAIIHGSAEDEVWVSVQRTINSSTVRFIEKFKPRDWGSDIEDAFFVDAGITDTSGSTTISGLDHLEGESLAVFADGEAQAEASSGDFTVTSGDITVASGLSKVQAGLPYTMKARTMRLSIPQEANTIQTRIKKVERTNIRYIRSLGGQAGQEYAGVEYLQNIEATFSTESQDTVPNNRLAQGGYSEDAFTTVISSDPAPFTMLASIVDVEVNK